MSGLESMWTEMKAGLMRFWQASWHWKAGAAVFAVIALGGVAGALSGGGDNRESGDTAQAVATRTPAATSKVRTPTPSKVRTATPTEAPTMSPAAGPTDAPTSTPSPAADFEVLGDELTDMVQRYFDAYNSSDFVRASGYVSEQAVGMCGGALNFALAFRQLQDSERLSYELVELTVNSVDGDRAFADVTINSYDIYSGKQLDDRLTLGQDFIRERHTVEGGEVNWVLSPEPLPILAVMAFCPS